MAGMPQSIVKRSEQILQQLETDNRQSGISKPIGEIAQQREGYQLSFFQLDDPVLEQIRDEIKNLDINNLTPVEALNKLNEVKRIIIGKWFPCYFLHKFFHCVHNNDIFELFLHIYKLPNPKGYKNPFY